MEIEKCRTFSYDSSFKSIKVLIDFTTKYGFYRHFSYKPMKNACRKAGLSTHKCMFSMRETWKFVTHGDSCHIPDRRNINRIANTLNDHRH